MRKILEVYSLTVRGGAETLMINHLKEMDRHEFHVDFVNHTQKKCDYDGEILSLGSHLYHMPKFRIFNVVSYIRVWFNFFKDHPDYDVVHVHYFTLAPIIIPIAKKCGVKTRITHSHINRKSSFYKRSLLNLFRRLMVNNSTLLMACSKEAGDNIFKVPNYVVFKNAIPSNKFAYNPLIRAKVRAELKVNEDVLVIGNIGSFRSQQKNHSFQIDVFKEVHHRNPNSILLFVGDGVLRPKVEQKVKDCHLEECVIFAGLKDHTEDYYQAMDVFLFPSLYEGLGIVAIEAQVSGLPVVMSDQVPNEACISDLVTVCNLNSGIDIWAETLMNMAKKPRNRGSYANCAKQAGFDVSENVKILESFYSN